MNGNHTRVAFVNEFERRQGSVLLPYRLAIAQLYTENVQLKKSIRRHHVAELIMAIVMALLVYFLIGAWS